MTPKQKGFLYFTKSRNMLLVSVFSYLLIRSQIKTICECMFISNNFRPKQFLQQQQLQTIPLLIVAQNYVVCVEPVCEQF